MLWLQSCPVIDCEPASLCICSCELLQPFTQGLDRMTSSWARKVLTTVSVVWGVLQFDSGLEVRTRFRLRRQPLTGQWGNNTDEWRHRCTTLPLLDVNTLDISVKVTVGPDDGVSEHYLSKWNFWWSIERRYAHMKEGMEGCRTGFSCFSFSPVFVHFRQYHQTNLDLHKSTFFYLSVFMELIHTPWHAYNLRNTSKNTQICTYFPL